MEKQKVMLYQFGATIVQTVEKVLTDDFSQYSIESAFRIDQKWSGTKVENFCSDLVNALGSCLNIGESVQTDDKKETISERLKKSSQGTSFGFSALCSVKTEKEHPPVVWAISHCRFDFESGIPVPDIGFNFVGYFGIEFLLKLYIENSKRFDEIKKKVNHEILGVLRKYSTKTYMLDPDVKFVEPTAKEDDERRHGKDQFSFSPIWKIRCGEKEVEAPILGNRRFGFLVPLQKYHLLLAWHALNTKILARTYADPEDLKNKQKALLNDPMSSALRESFKILETEFNIIDLEKHAYNLIKYGVMLPVHALEDELENMNVKASEEEISNALHKLDGRWIDVVLTL